MTYYPHMIKMAPNRNTPQCMEKKSNETFKEYARRWREVAAPIRLQLAVDEFSSIFIGTLKSPHYDQLFNMFGVDFAKIIKAEKNLERVIKFEKIENSSASKNVSTF